MKCPKCAYVGFEEADRCRHCGYDFSLVGPPPPAPAKRAVDGPRAVPYREPLRSVAAEPEMALATAAPLVDLPLSLPAPAAPVAPAVPPSLPPAVPASLFNEPQPPPARTPLAVRRTAERPRSRATPHVVRRPRQELLEAAGPDTADHPVAADAAPSVAPSMARIASALVDLALLAGIDAAVVYLTTQMAGLPVQAVTTLPIVPLAAFVLGLNVAYLAVFTANGGQTLGKMALGLRVEATDGALTFGSAIVRVAAAIAGGLAMGAGFLPALWRDDRRALHDQIAHTRVVKVSA